MVGNVTIFPGKMYFFRPCDFTLRRKKYTSGPRYWIVPVLVNTGTFLVYQYCLKMWYLRSLEHAGVIQKLTILEHKNGLVLSNTRVPVSGTWSLLFPKLAHPAHDVVVWQFVSNANWSLPYSMCALQVLLRTYAFKTPTTYHIIQGGHWTV